MSEHDSRDCDCRECVHLRDYLKRFPNCAVGEPESLHRSVMVKGDCVAYKPHGMFNILVLAKIEEREWLHK